MPPTKTAVSSLSLRNYRNYPSFFLKLSPQLTILVGPNAVGKTNLVEALQLLTAADSFRKPTWGDLVSWGESETRIEIQATGEKRSLSLAMEIDSTTGRRSYLVNGTRKKRVSEVKGLIPCVVFTPDDLLLIKGSAEKRRSSIDSLGDQLSPMYSSLRQEYSRVLKHRNSLLREGVSGALLDALDEQMAPLAARFTKHRVRLVERIQRHIEEIHPSIAEGERLSFVYTLSWGGLGVDLEDTDEATRVFLAHLEANRGQEEKRRATITGPHKDDIDIQIEGRNARGFASQGQQRTVSLAWKLAEVEVVSEVAGVPPILLLDDVMSELDADRREALAQVAGKKAQTVVTTTNIGYFSDEMIQRAEIRELS